MEYVIAVETEEGRRYIGEHFAIVRSKSEAVTYQDISTVSRKISQYTQTFPDKSFGIERADIAAPSTEAGF